MEIKHTSKKTNHLFAIIACIGLLFSCISIIRAFNEGSFFDALSGDIPTDTKSDLGKKIATIKDTMVANQAVQKQEYEKALQLISGTTSEDYYNRGTIQTLIAYQNALQSDISGLQNAQAFAAQAQQNFDIAKKLSSSKAISDAITDNQKTMASLSTVIDIKTCYGIGQNILTSMTDITTTIQHIKDTLAQEETYIAKRKSSLDAACYQKLLAIVDSSKEQVGLLQLQMEKNYTTYTSDFSDKIEDPKICIQTPYENILPSMAKGKRGLEEYQQQHLHTIEALTSNDRQSIKELCNSTKNDAQINQDIEDSVQELLQKLEDNKKENQQQERASNEVNYKDFFDEDEKKVLQDMEIINQGWIDTILEIRGKGNYTPERYIDSMFNQFYGNSGDFINLHK